MKQKLQIQKSGNGMHCIVLEEKNVRVFVRENRQRLICRLNGRIEFHCALLKTRNGEFFVNVAAKYLKDLKLRLGDFVDVQLFADESKFGLEMSEEFQEVLNSDTSCMALFMALTPGNQRSLIYLVSQPKSSDKRIERALKVADALKRGIRNAKEVMK